MVPDENPSDTVGTDNEPADTVGADGKPAETTGPDGNPTETPGPDPDPSNRSGPGDGGKHPSNGDSNSFLAPGDDAPADLASVLLYGVLGGIVGSVLSFIPFATVLGGGVAGYFCGGTSADALKTGAVAGLVMTLPFVAVVAFLLVFVGFAGAPAEFGALALLVVGIGAFYTLGSGVVGGYVGHYLRGEL